MHAGNKVKPCWRYTGQMPLWQRLIIYTAMRSNGTYKYTVPRVYAIQSPPLQTSVFNNQSLRIDLLPGQ